MAQKLNRKSTRNLSRDELEAENRSLTGVISAFVENIPGAFIVLDTEWRLAFMNDEAATLFGTIKEELQGASLEAVYPRRLGQLLSPNRLKEILESRERHTARYSADLKKWFSVSVSRNDWCVIVRLEDITARMLVDRVLRLNEFSVSTAPDLIFWIKPGGHIIYANDSACQSLDFERKDLLRLKIEAIDPGMAIGRWAEFVQEMKLTGRAAYETTLKARTGATIPVEVSLKYIQYSGEEYLVAMARNITKRKQAEAAVHEARAQAELYVDLMGHDINNMNMVGLGFLEMVLESQDLPDSLRPLLERSAEAFHSSSRLIGNVKQLRKISEQQEKSEVVDVGEILRNLTTHMEKAPDREVVIRCDCPRACRVKADPLIRDLFQNLIGNAIKHSTGSVAIDIHVQVVTLDKGKFCEITVEDNGPGISDKDKARLFERHREKRLRSKGLGLFIVKTLADRFGGTIRAEDRVQGDYTRGARFVVTLPAA